MDTARLSPLGVIVLALLRERDMHPYEMMRMLRARGRERLVPITNGTFYHTVSRLESAGLIAEVGIDRDGNRPERTTYALTGEGSAVIGEWVRRELPRIERPVEFRVALAEAHNLERDEVAELLGERRDALAALSGSLRDMLAGASERGIPRQYLIEVEREHALLTADLAWLDDLIPALADGSVPWGSAARLPGSGPREALNA